MKNRKIYETALCLLAEPRESLRLDDYAERTPLILESFIIDNSELDDDYRKKVTQNMNEKKQTTSAELDDEFPLSERFCLAASLYLASMLVIDSDGELYDKLWKTCADAVQKISDEITQSTMWTSCGESHGIVSVYGSIT